jgi:hypothetical protein
MPKTDRASPVMRAATDAPVDVAPGAADDTRAARHVTTPDLGRQMTRPERDRRHNMAVSDYGDRDYRVPNAAPHTIVAFSRLRGRDE